MRVLYVLCEIGSNGCFFVVWYQQIFGRVAVPLNNWQNHRTQDVSTVLLASIKIEFCWVRFCSKTSVREPCFSCLLGARPLSEIPYDALQEWRTSLIYKTFSFDFVNNYFILYVMLGYQNQNSGQMPTRETASPPIHASLCRHGNKHTPRFTLSMRTPKIAWRVVSDTRFL